LSQPTTTDPVVTAWNEQHPLIARRKAWSSWSSAQYALASEGENVMTQILVWDATVFKQPGSGGKVWRDCTHVGLVAYTMWCAKANGIGYCQTLVREGRGVQWLGTLLPKEVGNMF